MPNDDKNDLGFSILGQPDHIPQDVQDVVNTPQSIDKILSKEFLNLSLKDRSAIDEEIHGVGNLAPKETPEFLENALKELSRELKEFPDETPIKAAYIDSQMLPDTYVNTRDFRLRFLRCELFDAAKAALRLIKFLDFASHIFGPQVLQRPVRISDFSRQEKKQLEIGIVQLLPYRDQSGRKIYAWVVNSKLLEGTVVSRNKIALYLQYSISDDVESQRKGFIQLFWVGSSEASIIPEWEDFEYNIRLQESTPIRACSTHWCIPYLPLFHPIHMIRSGHALAAGKDKSRVKFHVGEKIELLYKLKTYGIPVEWIPVTDSGKIKTKYLKQWIRTRNTLEEARAKAQADRQQHPHHEPSADASIVECPNSTDVVFRGGTSLTCHPGNSVFQSMIESKVQEHSRASHNEKIAITKALIVAVRQQGGRFLQWDKRGWWTEMTDASETHFKVSEKVRRMTGKTLLVEAVRHKKGSNNNNSSSTFAFSNQDGGGSGYFTNTKKRRKLSPCYDRDASDGSGSSDEGGCCFF